MFQTIPIKSIIESGNNYRKTFDEKALADLTASVKAKGVLQPILVRPLAKKKGKFEIVAGHRRFRAANGAALKEMPCIVRELSDEDALEVQVIENTQREDPNPMEEAWGFDRLVKIGKHTPETLAEKLDRSVDYVIKRLKLLALPDAAQKKLISGEISQGHALLICRLKDPADQKEVLKDILESDISVREAKDRVRRHFSIQLKDAVFDKKKCETCTFRSRNQVAMFEDLKNTDECTDRDCFYTKTKTHYIAILKEKEEDGFKVLKNAKEILKLTCSGSKTSLKIAAFKKDASYDKPYPANYKSTDGCIMCRENHTFYLLETVENWSKRKKLEFGEICLKKSCLDKMNKQGKPEKQQKSANQIKYNRQIAARACVSRWIKRIAPAVIEADERFQKKLLLFNYIDTMGQEELGSFLLDFLPSFEKKNSYLYGGELYAYISQIPAGRLDEALEKARKFFIMKTSEKVIRALVLHDAGVDPSAEFEIDEEYLRKLDAEALADMAKSLNVDAGKVKATALFTLILGAAGKGFIPPDIHEILEEDKGEPTEEESEDDPCLLCVKDDCDTCEHFAPVEEE